MLFFPYRIDTLLKVWPIANWLIMAVTAVMFFVSHGMTAETLHGLVLGGTSATGLFAHLVLHADLVHLGGNLLFLWVFGNAVCGIVGNLAHPLLYLLCGLLAAAAHLAFDDAPAIGASGAINGIVGLAFALFPRNHVSVFWYFIARAGTFDLPFWVLALVWFVFDAWGAFAGGGDVAYWAHLGGFAAGLATGLVGLKRGWITLTEYDHGSLADVFKTKSAPKTKPANGSWAWEEPMTLRDETPGRDPNNDLRTHEDSRR